MLATALSASIVGVEGVPVRVEVDVAFGLPGLTIVGLAGSAVLEARERVRAALRNSGFEVPSRRITINLAPADLPEGGNRPRPGHGDRHPGRLGPAHGSSGRRDGADRRAGARRVAAAGSRRHGTRGGGARRRSQRRDRADSRTPSKAPRSAACGCAARARSARSRATSPASRSSTSRRRRSLRSAPELDDAPDLAAVSGQVVARRALEIAVAGRHNIAFTGPPGVGKTLLARAAAGLLPLLDDREATDVSRIYSVAGLDGPRAAAQPAAAVPGAPSHDLDPGARRRRARASGRARRASRIAARCSWTRRSSSVRTRSTPCADPSTRASSRSRGWSASWRCRPGSCCWPRSTRVHAAGSGSTVTRARARTACDGATRLGSRDRCAIGST